MSQAVAKEIPQEQGEGGSRRSSWGLLVTAGVGGTLVALYAVATPFVTPALRKVPALRSCNCRSDPECAENAGKQKWLPS